MAADDALSAGSMSDPSQSEDQVTELIETLVDLLDPLLGPDLSVGTRVEDGELVVEITAVLNGGHP